MQDHLSKHFYSFSTLKRIAVSSHLVSVRPCQQLASFPGSPRARTKNRKEGGEPDKIYHVRNVIGREDLITCGRTNKLAHAVWTDTVVQLR